MSKSNKVQQNIKILLEMKQDVLDSPFGEKEAITSLLTRITKFTNEVYGPTNPYNMRIKALVFVPDSFYSTPEDYKKSWTKGVKEFVRIIDAILIEFNYEPSEDENKSFQPKEKQMNTDIFPTIPSSLEKSGNGDSIESNELKIVFSPSTFETPENASAENKDQSKNRLKHLFKGVKQIRKTPNKKEKKEPSVKPTDDIYRSRIDEYMQKQIHKTTDTKPNKPVELLMKPFRVIGGFFKYLWTLADKFAALVEKDFKEFTKPGLSKEEKQKIKEEKSLQKALRKKQIREKKDAKNQKRKEKQ